MNSFTATLRCPDDRRPLRLDGEGAVSFAVCDHCSGLWFERQAIERRDDVRENDPRVQCSMGSGQLGGSLVAFVMPAANR